MDFESGRGACPSEWQVAAELCAQTRKGNATVGIGGGIEAARWGVWREIPAICGDGRFILHNL
jgi:hypothetical protein